MGLTRREFLTRYLPAILGLAFVGGLIGSEVYWDLKKPSNEIIYEENATETVTITVTKTYTSNTTVTETVTQTETVTENMTVTGTSTQTTTTTTQTSQSLEDILFGGSDIQFIPLEVTNVQIGTNNAYLTVYDYLTNTELQIKLPIQYVSNGNINIGNILSAVNNYNQNNQNSGNRPYRLYLILGRAGLSQAVLQNGKWVLPAPQIYYNILISDRGWQDVYNALLNLLNGNATVVMPTSYQCPYSNSLWAWIDGIGSVVTVYQSGQQVNSVEDYINLADYISETPNNPNPSSQGILHVDTIANVQQVGVYSSGGNQYPVYGVNDYYGTYIVLIPGKGNPLVSNL